MNWSFQLYSARKFEPWPEVLRTLREIGYAQVEGFRGVYDDPDGFRKALDGCDLAMPSGHFAFEQLESDFDGVARIADRLGIGLIVCPWLAPEQRPADGPGWRAFAGRLAAIGETAAKAGFSFAWHNHDFEFVPLPDGSLPMRHILDGAPGIGWEIDVAWLVRAGADPLASIAEFGKRILAVHVKDLAPAGQNAGEDGWADVGHGTIDWKRLIAALRAATPARIFAMEHDNPSDFVRFARQSLESVNNP